LPFLYLAPPLPKKTIGNVKSCEKDELQKCWTKCNISSAIQNCFTALQSGHVEDSKQICMNGELCHIGETHNHTGKHGGHHKNDRWSKGHEGQSKNEAVHASKMCMKNCTEESRQICSTGCTATKEQFSASMTKCNITRPNWGGAGRHNFTSSGSQSNENKHQGGPHNGPGGPEGPRGPRGPGGPHKKWDHHMSNGENGGHQNSEMFSATGPFAEFKKCMENAVKTN